MGEEGLVRAGGRPLRMRAEGGAMLWVPEGGWREGLVVQRCLARECRGREACAWGCWCVPSQPAWEGSWEKEGAAGESFFHNLLNFR